MEEILAEAQAKAEAARRRAEGQATELREKAMAEAEEVIREAELEAAKANRESRSSIAADGLMLTRADAAGTRGCGERGRAPPCGGAGAGQKASPR